MISEPKKLISQIKSLIVISSLLFSLFFSSLLFATDETQPSGTPNVIVQNNLEDFSYVKRGTDVIYHFVKNHEYLITPLGAALAGLVRCGAWCAGAGSIIGAMDEISIYFGNTDKRYLTWGLYGAVTGNILHPGSTTTNLAGLAFGILLPTGAFNGHTEIIAPLITSTIGTSGNIIGGALDELAINNGNTDKHYLTFFTVGQEVTTQLFGIVNPWVSSFIGVILGSLASRYEEEISDNFMAPVITAKKIYNTYEKFIPSKQLTATIEKEAIGLVGTQFMVQFLNLLIDNHGQQLGFNFHRLNNRDGQAWQNLKSETVNFAIFLFVYFIGNTISDQIDNYFAKNLRYSIEDQIRSEFFTEETSVNLSNDPSVKMLTDNLKSDTETLTSSGTQLIGKGISSSISGTYGIGVIAITSPDIIAYSFLYNQVQAMISTYLATQQSSDQEKSSIENSRIGRIMEHDAKNIRLIAEGGGLNATIRDLQGHYNQMRSYDSTAGSWGSGYNLWQMVSGSAKQIVNYRLVGSAINNQRIPFNIRGKACSAAWQVSDFLSFSGDNAHTIAKIDKAYDRIMILTGKMRVKNNPIDKIKIINKPGNNLIIQDFEMGTVKKKLIKNENKEKEIIKSEHLLTINDLTLEMGKRYALNGDPGCGKSLLLSKINRSKTKGVSGKGNIYYPLIDGREPKVVMITQTDYFPIDSSLQKGIFWPNDISEDPQQKGKIQTLLKEIKFQTSNLDENKDLDLESMENWGDLSGGEKKKLKIVSAIMQQPDILLLDETFVGLGEETTILVQQMLKKYLPPHTLVLVVDHAAKDNNYNFYDKELYLEQKALTVKEIPLKATPTK